MKKLRIAELYRELMPGLINVYGEREARQMLIILFGDLLNIHRQQFMAYPDRALEHDETETIRQAVAKLKDQVPIQYITGRTEFFDLKLLIEPGVLIPRPETEEMLHLIRNEFLDKIQPERILDVGTGSGCIALAMKKLTPEAEVIAVDISERALDVAGRNANRLKLDVDFVKLDFLKKKERNKLPGNFDMIISNPPYVRESEKPTMKANVLEHEPHHALFVDNNHPLIFYEKLCEFALDQLSARGMLVAEINEAFGSNNKNLFSKKFKEVEIRQDMSGKERFVLASR